MSREAVVIGGGLAGASLATLLALNGRSVLLIEKEKGPHHKVCGEFISWEAVNYLKRLGISLEALGAKPVTNVHINSDQKTIDIPLPFRAMSLSRFALDEALLLNAERSGVEIWRGIAVKGLVQKKASWEITTEKGDVIAAKTVFLASGKSDLREWHRPATPQSDLIGFKMHFHLSDEQTIALQDQVKISFFDNSYAGLELVEENIGNLCLVVQKEQYHALGKNWPSLLGYLQDRSPSLKQCLTGSTTLWSKPLAVSGMPYGYLQKEKDTKKNLYRLGDQIGVISSFTGDGMSMALHSGFLAAECYLNNKGNAAYRTAFYRDYKWPVKKSYWIAAVMLSKKWRPVFFLLCRWPKMVTWIIRSSRLRENTLVNQTNRTVRCDINFRQNFL